ncbi:hypothetical protein CPB97_002601 [Podila verticillata]|nr:hypothetical protein CPB97_002601 [Podila verticillata]
MSATDRCMALPEMVDKIISFLDKNNQIKCLRVNPTWHKFALAYVYEYVHVSDHSLDLLNRPGSQRVLARNAGHIQTLNINHPILLPLMAKVKLCTNLEILQHNFIRYTQAHLDMLGKLIRKNPRLVTVQLNNVFASVNLQKLVPALQTCQGLSRLYLYCQRDTYSRYSVEHCVSSHGLTTLLRGLAYPHLRLKRLIIEVCLGDAPGQALFEADRESSTAKFPYLDQFDFYDSGHFHHTSLKAIFLPMLREAPEVKALTLPEMSGSVLATATATLLQKTPPLTDLAFHRVQPMYVDIIKATRPTLRRLITSSDKPMLCEPLLRALLPLNDGTDICLQNNMQEIEIVLQESSTVSALIQKILTTLPNMRAFRHGFRRWANVPSLTGGPARLQIGDMVATPWVCVGLQELFLCLGSRTTKDGEAETKNERRAKIYRVYKQLGALRHLKSLILACDVLGGASEVELDFTFETGVRAMEPCLEHLALLDIEEVDGIRFSHMERKWALKHGPLLRRKHALQV